MSAYITLLTPMSDLSCLLEALTELGFDSGKVEVHQTPVSLVGYRGDKRTQVANVVIRRQHIGGASNDVGFLASPTGYQAFVSGYDHPRFGTAWLSKLNTSYQAYWTTKQAQLAAEERRLAEEARQQLIETQRQAVHQRARKLGYRVQESREGETIRLVLVKRTY
jgi:hypothetical protein